MLLRWAARLEEAGEALPGRLSPEVFAGILEGVPDPWLLPEPGADTPASKRQAYVRYLAERLEAAPSFVEEATRARAALV